MSRCQVKWEMSRLAMSLKAAWIGPSLKGTHSIASGDGCGFRNTGTNCVPETRRNRSPNRIPSLKGTNLNAAVAPLQGAHEILRIVVGFRSFLAAPDAINFVPFRGEDGLIIQ